MIERNLPLPDGLRILARQKHDFISPAETFFIFIYSVLIIIGIFSLQMRPTLFPFLLLAVLTIPIIFRIRYSLIIYVLLGAIVLVLLLFSVNPKMYDSIASYFEGYRAFHIHEGEGMLFFLFIGCILLILFIRRGKNIDPTIRRFADEIEEGNQISDALDSCFPGIPGYHMTIIRNGEKSGRLVEALNCIIGYETTRKRGKLSMLFVVFHYPLALLFLYLFLYGFILIKIMPKLHMIMEELGISPPYLTRMMFSITHLFFANTLLIFMGILCIIVILILFMPIIINFMPIIGKIYRRLNTARIFTTLGYGLQSGLTINDIVPNLHRLAGRDRLNRHYIKRFQVAIMKGARIGESLGDIPTLTKEGIALANLAEDGDLLDRELVNIGNHQFEIAADELARFITYLAPIVHLCISFVILISILSVYSAIFCIPLMVGK